MTEQWARWRVAGPQSREVLAQVVDGLDVTDAAFPSWAWAKGRSPACPVRIFRISFSGELAYEINAPARFGEQVWEALLAAGGESASSPMAPRRWACCASRRAIRRRRARRPTTAEDLGLGRMVRRRATSSAASRRAAGDGRPEPAAPRGFVPVDATRQLRAGAHLLRAGSGRSRGYVTSVTRSIELGQWIGLALFEDAGTWGDKRLWAVSPLHTESVEVVVTSPCFVDPENARGRA